jgi:hypothetical protein
MVSVGPEGVDSFSIGFFDMAAAQQPGNLIAGWLGNLWSGMEKVKFYSHHRRACRSRRRGDILDK